MSWRRVLARVGFAAFVAIALLTVSRSAAARVERFALVIGNDRGDGDDTPLRFAESDASRVYDVLKDIGGFAPANMVLLRGENRDVVLRTLVSMNERVRTSVASPDTQVIFFVYYSGHADASQLHLAGTRLDLVPFEQLVRGSAASFRVLLVDACRSGALTRVKGGRPAPPIALTADDRLAGEGVVFLTASSASEDAQESDELKGSFFTHYFVSGLVGAADADGDGRVLLEEAYRYAYENTIRATSRTWAGIQHPTFQYDLRGQGKIILTELAGASRATIVFPAGQTYLLFQNDAGGAVVSETSATARSRRVVVKPGRYFVRGRAKDALFEGEVVASAGQVATVRDEDLHRIGYARLVRKGAAEGGVVHGPAAGYVFRGGLPTSGPCQGAYASYVFALQRFTVSPRVHGCFGAFENANLGATTTEVGAEVRVAHAWDLPFVTVDLGVAGGAALLGQTFSTAGRAPSRTSVAATVAASVGLSTDLGRGVYLTSETAAVAYIYEQATPTGASVAPQVAFRESLGIGKHW